MTDTTTTEPARPSTKDRLKGAKLPERTVDICLRGDLQAEWEDLHRQLADAELAAAKDKRLAGDKRARDIGEQITAVQDQMRADTIVFRMRGLGRKRWDRLMKEHPPRKDNDEDTQLGYNADTFMEALIRACTYSPDDLDDDTWAELLGDDKADGKLTEWQFAQLQNTALALNVRKVDVPNSFAASRLTQPS
ncbi:hypothetical protein MED01_002397 [Micromonospora sp. MED01]|uniref:hypothetical protein n=1 Tax=Micromonospora alfalfae TaxID=2911212 RepID=UPI001EE967B2|nr:hypothetical protein [Micromonospora alfalfae]MCG5464232.1 hypothetical protein [Micromonospora alfalfae]